MRTQIIFSAEKALVLPINYHHILQGVIYEAIKPTDKKNLHDKGYGYNDKRIYKMFVFSLLNGIYNIEDKSITFTGEVSFTVASPDSDIIEAIEEYFLKHGIRFGDRHFENIRVKRDDTEITERDIAIRASSPIITVTTDPVTKKTRFFTPLDREFAQLVNDNFRRKYTAFYGAEPKGEIRLTAEKVSPRDKYVTRYKQMVLSGWRGIYRLHGKPEYLQFLYQTGLGSRNSQGFGLFDVIG